jgi:hypothetical protein
MEEEQKKQIAVFRFGVIHEFVGGAVLDYGEQERLLEQKCARKWQIPYSERTRISRAAILSWIKRYNDNGGKLESLYPKDRQDRAMGIYSRWTLPSTAGSNGIKTTRRKSHRKARAIKAAKYFRRPHEHVSDIL